MAKRKSARPATEGDLGKKSNSITQIIVAVVITLIAGSSAPWWWSKVFPERPTEQVVEGEKPHDCPKGYFYLQSRATDLYLDLDHEGRLIQSSLNGAETQIWTTISTSNDGYCYLATKDSTNRNRDECLEVKRGMPDDYIGLGTRRTLNADDQQWAFTLVEPGYYVITLKSTKNAIDVPYGKDTEGLLLCFFWPHMGSNQRWKLIPF